MGAVKRGENRTDDQGRGRGRTYRAYPWPWIRAGSELSSSCRSSEGDGGGDGGGGWRRGRGGGLGMRGVLCGGRDQKIGLLISHGSLGPARNAVQPTLEHASPTDAMQRYSV